MTTLAAATLPGVSRIDLTGEEVPQRAVEVVAGALRLVDTVEDAELYRRAPLLARHLPERLALFLADFRLREQAGACVIGGWRVDDGAIDPTPGHWRVRPGPSSALSEEVYLVLLASVLGDVYSRSTVQGGRLVQDLVPIRGEDQEKNGNSSDSLLELY